MPVLLPVAGLAIGILVSLMGGGGGIFYIIILTGLFHLPVPIAASTSLATIIPTTLMAFSSHYRQGNIKVNVALWLILGAVAGAVIGSYSSAWIPPAYQTKILGLILLAILVPMLKRKKQSGVNTPQTSVADGETGHDRETYTTTVDTVSSARAFSQHLLAVFYGLFGGIMSGMVGISGTPPILAGLYALGFKAKEVVGTSLMVLLAIGITGFIAHFAIGLINWQIVILLGVGTVTGAFIGPLLLNRIDTDVLEKFYEPFFFLLVGFFGLYELLV
ncbi:sulfite exporter TauE/SafE family protein [Desulfotomaculum copahuensis]|uniref:Probable membrane transporter protein n=1 Tax=Desulfotomaculum copahuensis TaxID=1838280 RepID=A0A1B7LIZ5_9FIRM|nr:sulfite exporter TauE/SafE family protein [Desulfotomaculum copahuensis]OAT86550.1 hypothetical protein A6M21_03100 [Desulfotomaculum copahuensis]